MSPLQIELTNTFEKQRPMSQTEHAFLLCLFFWGYSVYLRCCWSILLHCQLLDWYLMLRGKKCGATIHDVWVCVCNTNSIFYWWCWKPLRLHHAFQIMCENFKLNHKYARNVNDTHRSLSINRWESKMCMFCHVLKIRTVITNLIIMLQCWAKKF